MYAFMGWDCVSGGCQPKVPKRGCVNFPFMRFSISIFPWRVSDFSSWGVSRSLLGLRGTEE